MLFTPLMIGISPWTICGPLTYKKGQLMPTVRSSWKGALSAMISGS